MQVLDRSAQRACVAFLHAALTLWHAWQSVKAARHCTRQNLQDVSSASRDGDVPTKHWCSTVWWDRWPTREVLERSVQCECVALLHAALTLWHAWQSVKAARQSATCVHIAQTFRVPALDGHVPTKHCVHALFGGQVAIQCRQNAVNVHASSASHVALLHHFDTLAAWRCGCAPLHAFTFTAFGAHGMATFRPHWVQHCLVGRWSVRCSKGLASNVALLHHLTLWQRGGAAARHYTRAHSQRFACTGWHVPTALVPQLFGGQVVREVLERSCKPCRIFAPL